MPQEDNSDVYHGGTLRIGDCISVPKSDKQLVLGITSYAGLDNATTWFAIK